MVKQLTDGCTMEEIKAHGYDAFYVEHGLGIFPQNAGGIPASALTIQSKGDPVTDLYEDMAAEQKARSTYEYLIDLIDDPDVLQPLKFLRTRELVHFQRFGEALEIVRQHLSGKHHFYGT